VVILLVEDHDEVYEFYSDALATAGHVVNGAADGEQAMSEIARSKPDLILLDLGLPHMDGFEVARRLRSDPTTQHIPIVAITGYGVNQVAQRARDAGCDSILFKPCSVDEVLEEVSTQLRNRRQC
jgi:CheY-like chemotaxis protein